jgi:glycosyltransferase involved in cell wall biosynthesis
VGDGDLRKEIQEKIKALQLESAVILTGVRSNVPDFMQMMDVFLFPSLFEGVPLTMVEAQAAGLPCYISDKVPIECRMTQLVQQISLERSACEWAEQILSGENTRNQNPSEEIKKAQYDINSNAQWLQKYYLEEFEKV